MKDQVLKAMREAGKPVSAGDVTKMLDADRKVVDKCIRTSTRINFLLREGSGPPLFFNTIKRVFRR